VAYYVDLLADVLNVKPTVISKGKSIEAQVYVETAPGINIPAKTAEIKETVRRVVEEELGLQLKGEVKVTIKPVYPKYEIASRRGQRQTPLPAARPEPVDISLPDKNSALADYAPPLEAPELEEAIEEPDSELIEVKTQAAEEPAGE
jgi:hypothetical protein